MSQDDANFFRELRAKLKAGTASIFAPEPPAPRICTPDAPDRGAKYHHNPREIGTVVRRDGEYTRYECTTCGAEWER